MTNSRLAIFDLTKILLSLLVINFHIESFIIGRDFSLFYYLGWYAVPLFVIIFFYFNSKYIFQNFPISSLILKTKRLYVPFFVWSCIGFAFHLKEVNVKYLLRQFIFGTAVNPPLYYLLILILFLVFSYLISKISQKTQIVIFILIILISLLIEIGGSYQRYLEFIPVQAQFFIIRSIELLKYMSVGVLLGKHRLEIGNYLIKRNTTWVILILGIIFAVADSIYKLIQAPSILGYFGVFQFIAAALIMVSLIRLQDFIFSNKISKNIFILGNVTFGVYCMHYLIIECLWFLSFSNVFIEKNKLIISLMVGLCCFCLSLIIKKYSKNRLSWLVS